MTAIRRLTNTSGKYGTTEPSYQKLAWCWLQIHPQVAPNFQPSSTNTPLVNPGFQPTQQSLLSIKLLVFLVVTCMQMEKLSCYWITAMPPKN
jgi:hypothetical protein